MSTFGAENTTHDHRDWLIRKETTLRRHKLDCGHPNAGEVFFHAWCDRLTCSGECANAAHDCSAFGGVKSGIEEEHEPVEAVEIAGNAPIPLNDDGSRFAMNSRPGLFRQPEPGSPWLTLADIGGRPDRVAEALRAEVRRQGLDEETIRIEAIRPARPFLVPALAAELDSLAEHLDEAWRAEAIRQAPAMSECPDDSNIATRPRWWQWRRRQHD